MAKNFLTASDPAFEPGRIWGNGAKARVEIIKVRQWGDTTNPWHYDVDYRDTADDTVYTKDLWNFQVRFLPEE